MKRFLPFLLIVLILLQCACAPHGVEPEDSKDSLDTEDEILTDSETETDADSKTETDIESETESSEETDKNPPADTAPVKTVYAHEYAYVRAGVWHSKNWHDILEERGLEPMLILKNGNEQTDVTRYVLLRFDISHLNANDVGKAELSLNFTGIQSGTDVPFAVYLVENNWDESSVTWDSRPEKLVASPVVKDVILKEQTADVTAAVKAMIAQGESEMSLMILQTEATKNETRIKFSSLTQEQMPRLVIDRDGTSDAPEIDIGKEREMAVRYLHTTEYAYVRCGSSDGHIWEDMNWHDILAVRGLSDRIVLKDGEANNHVSRLGLFRFCLDGLTAEDVGYAEFFVRFSDIEDGKTVHFDLYLVENSWDESTVTWNTMPKKLGAVPAISDAVFGSLKKVDATQVIRDLLMAGKTEFTLLLVQTDKTKTETKIEIAKVGTSNMPHFKVYRKDPTGGSSYIQQLVANDQRNQDIWDRAKQMFDEWYARYTVLKNKPLAEADKIESDLNQYTETVYSPGSNPSNSMIARPTRTMGALDDLADYVDINEKTQFDVYGGVMNEALRQEATGFFYTKKIGDRWWVIDPLGYPCYLKSVSGITTSYQNSPTQKAAFEAKYDSKEQWAEETTRHLIDDLGFTTQSSADAAIRDVSHGFSYFKRISIMSGYASSVGINASIGGRTRLSENNTLPVFDPAFEKYADQRLATAVDPYDPYLIGYITDNELAIEDHMLKDYLTIDASKEVNYYSYACAWYWITQMTGKQVVTDDDLTPELCDLFRGFVWDRYYYVVDTALEKHDPNHLFAGTKYLNEVKESEWILRFTGEYVDIITINWYGAWEPQAEYIYDFARYADTPFMVSEFYAKSSDTEDKLASKDGGGFYVRTQEERGLFYQNYTLRLLEAKNCVGWQWFQYIDNDPASNTTDVSSRDSNKGIVSNTHKEYTELTDDMTLINKNVYKVIEYFDEKYSE